MTMRIVFLQDVDEHKKGDEAYIPRPDARRLCEDGKAVPYMTWADAEAKEEKEKPAPKPKPKPKRKYKKREKAVTVNPATE